MAAPAPSIATEPSPLLGSNSLSSIWGRTWSPCFSQANGKFVTVTSGLTPTLVANGAKVTTAATFQWTPNADGTVYLKSAANGRYVTVTPRPIRRPCSRPRPPPGLPKPSASPVTAEAAAPNTPRRPDQSGGEGGRRQRGAIVDGGDGCDLVRRLRQFSSRRSRHVARLGVKTASASITGLKSGTPYSFAVTALNAQACRSAQPW